LQTDGGNLAGAAGYTRAVRISIPGPTRLAHGACASVGAREGHVRSGNTHRKEMRRGDRCRQAALATPLCTRQMRIGTLEDILAARANSDEESPTLMYLGGGEPAAPLTVLYPDAGDHLLSMVVAIWRKQRGPGALTVAFTGACPAFRAPCAFHVWRAFWYLLNSLFVVQTLAFLRWYLRIEIDLLAFGAGAPQLAKRARRRGFAVYAAYTDYIGAHARFPRAT
jgi:hypothetical protein